jgi:hypothetical protein
MLGAAYLLFALTLQRRMGCLLALAGFAYLTGVPARIPEARFLDPAPHGPPDSPWFSDLGQNERWTYRFRLKDLGKYQEGTPFRAYLQIDGVALASLRISVQGRALEHLPTPVRKGSGEHLAIPLELPDQDSVLISLRAAPGTKPRIFCGPEVHGLNIYSDAVWLEFGNSEESVLYHARRVEGAAGNP